MEIKDFFEPTFYTALIKKLALKLSNTTFHQMFKRGEIISFSHSMLCCLHGTRDS